MEVSKELYEAYGRACVQLEVSQNAHTEAKKKIIEALNKLNPETSK